MKFDQAINEGYGRYVSDQESRMIPVSEEVLRTARESCLKLLLVQQHTEQNEDLMKLYHHTYLDLDQALRDCRGNPGI